MASRAVILLRTAAIVCIVTGLIGGAVWSVDLLDRVDGDDLRWGFWPNPFMAFGPFSEAFLDASMWVLFGCSAVIGLGGLLMLAPLRLGVRLVVWQAPVSIVTNGIVVGAIALMALGVLAMDWTGEALALRLGSIVVNVALCIALKSSAVTNFFAESSSRGTRA